MRNIIIAAIAIASISSFAVAQEATTATKPKKVSQMEMLTAVCASKAIKSEKLSAACIDAGKIAGLQLASTVTIKAPGAELKALFANVASFQ